MSAYMMPEISGAQPLANLDPYEQLMLELVNRARLDPVGEVQRVGGQGAGLASGTPNGPVAVLAAVPELAAAAQGHSNTMLSQNFFAHTNPNTGSTVPDRIDATGYGPGGYAWGENISWRGSTGSINLASFVLAQHEGLWRSDGHQRNILSESFSEIGIGRGFGAFTSNGTTYTSTSMITQKFADRGYQYLTGVVIDDRDGDAFYDVGEGQGAVRITAWNASVTTWTETWDAGGYTLRLDPGVYRVRFEGGELSSPVETTVRIGAENLKLDVFEGIGIHGETGIFGARFATSGDFDGDGIDDSLWLNPVTNAIGQFQMSPASAEWRALGTGADGWDVAGTGDFNGDGTDDILWFDPASGTLGQFQMTNGTASWRMIGAGGTGWEVAGTGDFNGDGTDDILWFNPATGALGQFQMSGGGAAWRSIGFGAQGWTIAGTGDFNGDGTDDILWLNPLTGELGQFQMSNGASIWRPLGTASQGWDIAGIGDLNGDGTDDILWFNDATGEVGQFRMVNGSPSWRAIGTGAQGWDVMGTGDFNGDGVDDVLWQNPATGGLGQYRMSDAGAAWRGLGWAGDGWELAASNTDELLF